MKAKRVVKNKGLRALRARGVTVGRMVERLTRLGDRLEAAGDPQWFVAAQAAVSLERLRMARAALNSQRRIAICSAAGANSFDGTSASRFAVSLRPLDSACRQEDLYPASSEWIDV